MRAYASICECMRACFFNAAQKLNTITEVSKDILPDEKLDCVVYGCTSGTIAAGYDAIKKKVELAKLDNSTKKRYIF